MTVEPSMTRSWSRARGGCSDLMPAAFAGGFTSAVAMFMSERFWR